MTKYIHSLGEIMDMLAEYDVSSWISGRYIDYEQGEVKGGFYGTSDGVWSHMQLTMRGEFEVVERFETADQLERIVKRILG